MSNLEVQTNSLETNELLIPASEIEQGSKVNSKANSKPNKAELQNLNKIEMPNAQIKESVDLVSKEIEQIRIPNNPVEVMQILQVLDRQKYTELESLVEEKENVRDAIEFVIEKIYKKQSGLAGLFTAALKGRKIPQDLAAQLDVLVEYEEELESFINKMVNAIAKSRDLTEKSEINADLKNKLVLKQRAIMELENTVPSHNLDKYRKNCKEVEFFSKRNIDSKNQ